MKTQTFQYKDASIIVGEMTDDVTKMCRQLTNFNTYREEYDNLKHEKRKKEFLCVRIALNDTLDKEVKIIYDEHRKPAIADNKMHLSISHSGPFFALMLHPRSDVGIDLECRTNRVLNVYKRFLNTQEQELFYHPEDTRSLEIVWSAKEALYKIIGHNAVDFTKSLTVHPFTPAESGIIRATHQHETSTKDFDIYYTIDSAYTMAACIDLSNSVI